jgi:hypothetical protein
VPVGRRHTDACTPTITGAGTITCVVGQRLGAMDERVRLGCGMLVNLHGQAVRHGLARQAAIANLMSNARQIRALRRA